MVQGERLGMSRHVMPLPPLGPPQHLGLGTGETHEGDVFECRLCADYAAEHIDARWPARGPVEARTMSRCDGCGIMAQLPELLASVSGIARGAADRCEECRTREP